MALDCSKITLLKKWPLHKFLSVGVLNTAIGGFVIVYLMSYHDMDPFLANCIGYTSGFVLSYFLNSSWTFGTRNKSFSGFIFYIAILFVSYCVNLIILYIGIVICYFNEYAVQIIAMAAYTLFSFFGTRIFVFKYN